MIGSRDIDLSSVRLVRYALANRVIFYISGGKSFADVELVAKVIVCAMEKGRLGQIYLLAGGNMSYRKFFEKISQVQGKRKIYVKLPNFFLNYFNSKKAKIELNYESTVISHSIDKTLKWLKAIGKI